MENLPPVGRLGQAENGVVPNTVLYLETTHLLLYKVLRGGVLHASILLPWGRDVPR